MLGNAWAKRALCAILAISAAAIMTSTASAAPTCSDTWIGGHGPVSQPNDWDTTANWSAGVPTTNTAVCIETGSAVLTDGDAGSVNIASLDIGSSGTAQLTVSIHDVVQSSSTTVGTHGTLVLNGTYNGANAGNASLGGGTVDNTGTIVMETLNGYSATLWGTILNQGTINVPSGTVQFCQGGNGGAGSVDNQGAINVAAASAYPSDPAAVEVAGCAFTDDTGGTIVNNGSFSVGAANGVAASYTQGNGTETGNAISTGQNTTVNWAGTGAGSVNVPTSQTLTMTGNLAADQQLYLNIGANVTEAGSFTSAGQITLDGTYYSGGGGPALLIVSSGTFTNTGTLTAISDAALSGNVVNNGTMTIEPNSKLELQAGSFSNGASGSIAPQISSSALGYLQIDNGTTFTPGGTLEPELEGGFTPTTGQEFTVVYTGGYSGQFATSAGNWHADYSSTSTIGAIYGAGANVTSSTPATSTPTSTPTPTSAPTPTTGKPTVVAAPGVTSLAGGAAVIDAKLRCASAKACSSYELVASVTEHLMGTKLVSLTALKARTKVVTVASDKGSLGAGRTVSVKLTLNKAGQALLKRYGKLKVNVIITAGGKTLKRETVTVTRAKVLKKKK